MINSVHNTHGHMGKEILSSDYTLDYDKVSGSKAKASVPAQGTEGGRVLLVRFQAVCHTDPGEEQTPFHQRGNKLPP